MSIHGYLQTRDAVTRKNYFNYLSPEEQQKLGQDLANRGDASFRRCGEVGEAVYQRILGKELEATKHPTLQVYLQDLGGVPPSAGELPGFSERFTARCNRSNIQQPDGFTPMTAQHFEDLLVKNQTLESTLQTIWQKTLKETDELNPQEIQARLEDPAYRNTIQCIVSMNLTSMNAKRVLPPIIGRFTGIETLNVRNCGLTDLPREIGDLGSLKNLNLSGNFFERLPEEIGKLPLESLNLSSNKFLEELPESFVHLVGMKKLNLPWNPSRPLFLGFSLLFSNPEQIRSQDKSAMRVMDEKMSQTFTELQQRVTAQRTEAIYTLYTACLVQLAERIADDHPLESARAFKAVCAQQEKTPIDLAKLDEEDRRWIEQRTDAREGPILARAIRDRIQLWEKGPS